MHEDLREQVVSRENATTPGWRSNVRGPRAAERVLVSVSTWIQKHLPLEVNATKSEVVRPWERKFLGFTITPEGQVEVALKSVERFELKVREIWRSCQRLSSNDQSW